MIYEKVKVEESIEPIYVRNSFSKPEREKKAKKNREKEKAAFEEVMSWVSCFVLDASIHY